MAKSGNMGQPGSGHAGSLEWPNSSLGRVQSLLPFSDAWLALTDKGIYQSEAPGSSSWRAFPTSTTAIQQADGGPVRLHRDGTLADSPFHLADINISALAIDRDRNLWVGYFDRGLEVFSARGERLLREENERLFCINHILALSDGRVLVSTANGLAVFSGTVSRDFITEKQGLIHRAVAMTLPLELGDDRLLAATAEGVTLLRRNQPVQNFFALHGLASNHVYCAASLGGRIYLGTLAGISVLENARIVFSWNTANSGLAMNWVNAMAVLKGQLFVGTYGGGIQSLDANGQWTNHGPTIGTFEVNSNAMAIDGSRLYAGSLDRGFFVYDSSSNQWRHIQDGLPSQNVTAFAFDSDNVLVGTDAGLLKVRKDAL
jgi:ligand-binding sensor domain-containing protein